MEVGRRWSKGGSGAGGGREEVEVREEVEQVEVGGGGAGGGREEVEQGRKWSRWR